MLIFHSISNTSEEHLREIFSNYGVVKRVKLNVRDRTAISQGIAFVEMASNEEAKTFGGKLMYPNGRQIAIKPFSGGAVVGWIDALETAASKFQSGDSASTSAAWRHYLYRRGFSHDDVPKVAITPERPVVDPVAGESAGKFPEWMLGAMQTILQRRIKRASLNYSRTGATAEGSRAAATVADAYSALSMIKGAM